MQCVNAESPLGIIPDGWNLRRLGELASKVGSGATPRGGSSVYLLVRKNFALIRSQNVLDRRFDGTDLVYIRDVHARELQNSSVQEDDVLLNITGDGITFSRACKAPKHELPACVNQHVSIIRPIPGVLDSDYLLSFLTHPLIKGYIEAFNSGGSRRAITKGHIESFEIPLPPIAEQRNIAHILGTLDNKIELNRRMNETLEAMARAIFKSWFIDFDPVRAKAEGRQPEGMDAETAALFPDGFEDSELGEIPRGWGVKSLDEIAIFLNGLACQKYAPVEGKDTLPVIKIRELRQGITANTDRATTEVPVEFIVNDGDVLFSWSGSLLVDIWCKGRGVLNQHVFKVSSSEYPKWYYYFWTSFHLDKFQGIAADKATTMGHIKRSHLTEAKVLVPSNELLDASTRIIDPLIDMRINKEFEAIKLSTIRNALLPKLLSGEIRIKDAEKLTGQVA